MPFPPTRLYAILDTGYVNDADWEAKAIALLRGGAGILQVRAKGLPPSDVARLALRVQPICRDYGVPLVINDHPEVAARIMADGLHIGQDDGALAEARRIVGPEVLIGRSTHAPAQASAAAADGFDYIGFGPLFPTATKPGRPAIGLGDLAVLPTIAPLPAFAIGGIHAGNLDAVLDAGARRVVIVSALLTAPDTESATRAVAARLAARFADPA